MELLGTESKGQEKEKQSAAIPLPWRGCRGGLRGPRPGCLLQLVPATTTAAAAAALVVVVGHASVGLLVHPSVLQSVQLSLLLLRSA